VQYTVVIEPADDGSFSVWVPDLPGCVSSGDSKEDALQDIREAIRGHIETLRAIGQPVPPPRSTASVVWAA
jgi:predicted RNase H-like HicB family nuclease